MSGVRLCRRCGAELRPDTADGLCPGCLLKLAMETGPGSAAEAAPSEPGGDARPDLAQLAQHFPQLEILDLLGQGGMGVVYKARHTKLDRIVALKILPTRVGLDPAFAERFIREARALARLDHPGIVAVYDFGQSERLYYLIMQFVDGADLRQVMRAGKLAPAEAMRVVPQICEALQYAHEQGIVHRDIKPENILLDRKGQVKIADFGLAKLLVRAPAEVALTNSGQVMGTPHYMAPEQMERPLAVDHRADIYSLGVVFYEMLTGELPLGRFAAPSAKVQVDIRLDQIVLRSLEKEPERRYQHVSEVKTEVEAIASIHKGPPGVGTSTVAPAPGARRVTQRPARRERPGGKGRWCAAIALVGGLLGAVGAILAGSLSDTWYAPRNISPVPGVFFAGAILACLGYRFHSLSKMDLHTLGAIAVLSLATAVLLRLARGGEEWVPDPVLLGLFLGLDVLLAVGLRLGTDERVRSLLRRPDRADGDSSVGLTWLLICLNLSCLLVSVSFAPRATRKLEYHWVRGNEVEHLVKAVVYEYLLPFLLGLPWLITMAGAVASVGIYIFTRQRLAASEPAEPKR